MTKFQPLLLLLLNVILHIANGASIYSHAKLQSTHPPSPRRPVARQSRQNRLKRDVVSQQQQLFPSEMGLKKSQRDLLERTFYHAFRARPIIDFMGMRYREAVRGLIKDGFIMEPSNPTKFIPELHRPSVSEIVKPSAGQSVALKGAGDALADIFPSSSTPRQTVIWGDQSAWFRGHAFEEHHMSWILGMRAHHASWSFFGGDDGEGKTHKQSTLTGYFLGASQRDRREISLLLDAFPKGSLQDTHNGVEALHPQPFKDRPFLLYPKYSIMTPAKSSKANNRPQNALQKLSDADFIKWLSGGHVLRNTEAGAGYDYVIVDWVPAPGTTYFRLTVTFIEMKFSMSGSSARQGINEVLRKWRLCSDIFEETRARITQLTDVQIDCRLIMCVFRELDDDLDKSKLPDNVAIYDYERLVRAYGPTIAEQPHFKR